MLNYYRFLTMELEKEDIEVAAVFIRGRRTHITIKKIITSRVMFCYNKPKVRTGMVESLQLAFIRGRGPHMTIRKIITSRAISLFEHFTMFCYNKSEVLVGLSLWIRRGSTILYREQRNGQNSELEWSNLIIEGK